MRATGSMGFVATSPSGTSSVASNELSRDLRQEDQPQTPLVGLEKSLAELEGNLSKITSSIKTIQDTIEDGFLKVYVNGGVNQPDWKGTPEDKKAIEQIRSKIPQSLLKNGQTILSVSRQFTTMSKNSKYDFEKLDRLVGSNDIYDKLKEGIKRMDQTAVNLEFLTQLATSVLTERTETEKANVKQANLVQLATYLKNNINSRYLIRDNIKAFLEELVKLEMLQWADSLLEIWSSLSLEIFKLLVEQKYFRREGQTDNYVYVFQTFGSKLVVNLPSKLLENVSSGITISSQSVPSNSSNSSNLSNPSNSSDSPNSLAGESTQNLEDPTPFAEIGELTTEEESMPDGSGMTDTSAPAEDESNS